MTQANSSSYVDLTFVFSDDDAAYRQAFCISPRDDSCPFGPCPNPDVTGLGQQISIYITTMSYGFILCYIPSLRRPMLYAHLSVLYSLLIAGTVSIAKHELTKADSIFVLICVASPVSIYLWIATIWSIWNARVFPIEHRNKKKTTAQSLEVRIAKIVTLGSFAYTIAYLLITFIPSDVIQFAQPGCDRDYGIDLWFNLAWMLPVALQMSAIALIYTLAWAAIRVWTKRPSYNAPLQVFDDQVDIITWTEIVLSNQFPTLSHTSITCIVIILQLSSLPTFEAPAFVSKDICTLGVLIYVVWSRPSPRHVGGPNPSNLNIATRISSIGRRICMSAVLGGYIVVRFMGAFLVPTLSDGLFFFIACTAAVWCRRRYRESGMYDFLPAFLVIYGLLVALLVGSSITQLPINTIMFSFGDRPTLENIAESGFSPASLDVASLGLWVVLWLSTSVWPFKRNFTWNQLGNLVFKRAHILKCCVLILSPHVLWIMSTSLASPTRSSEMPFGQIFALIVAIMTLLTLLDEARDVRAEVWWAFVKSDCMPSDIEERSMELASLPQTRDPSATNLTENASPPIPSP